MCNIARIKLLLQTSIDSTPKRSAIFFKTGIGDYAEHDHFMGITVPTIRKIDKQFQSISFNELEYFMCSKFNEERLLALIILTSQYKQVDIQKENVYQFYIKHLNYVNNWNLVDSSAHLIIGAHLWNKDKSLLLDLAKSTNLWKRRISIIATLYFIKQQKFEHPIKISILLLNDTHDLIHKAVEWMLREVGKRDQLVLIDFLERYYKQIPRTMLRYAIERLG